MMFVSRRWQQLNRGLWSSPAEVIATVSGLIAIVGWKDDFWEVILEGEGTYRFGTESYPIKAGCVLGAGPPPSSSPS